MNNKDINDLLAVLQNNTYALEDAYIEGGGEITEDTEAIEKDIAAIKELLAGEGIDSLGRWLKAKEDERDTYKAEKAMADRKIKAATNTIDYIKKQIGTVLRAAGIDKAKGTYYSFQPYDSNKSAILSDALDDAFLESVQTAARAAGLPDCIDVALKTTIGKLNEGGLTDFVTVEVTPTAKYTKPRKPKDDN